MQVISTNIPDVKIIEPKVFGDERGFFSKLSVQIGLNKNVLMLILCKTIILNLAKVFFVVCTISWSKPKAN